MARMWRQRPSGCTASHCGAGRIRWVRRARWRWSPAMHWPSCSWLPAERPGLRRQRLCSGPRFSAGPAALVPAPALLRRRQTVRRCRRGARWRRRCGCRATQRRRLSTSASHTRSVLRLPPWVAQMVPTPSLLRPTTHLLCRTSAATARQARSSGMPPKACIGPWERSTQTRAGPFHCMRGSRRRRAASDGVLLSWDVPPWARCACTRTLTSDTLPCRPSAGGRPIVEKRPGG
mmetsp:Transcript_95236/g.308407  ORF Transcript_95236/g.308407 Transcript_95236/m.308407 type:complete len:233 (+) Transcript_95236:3528-4226(+)